MTNEEFQARRKERFELATEADAIRNLMEQMTFVDFRDVKEVRSTLNKAYTMIDVSWRLVAKLQLFLACDELLKERMEQALGARKKGENNATKHNETKRDSDSHAS